MRSLRQLFVAFVVLLLAFPEIACADDDPLPSVNVTVVQTPVEALRLYVEDQGMVFAGECAVTISPDDLGKTCWKLVDQRENVQAYLIGRTFSEYSAWVFVEEREGGYVVSTTKPLDFYGNGAIPWP